MNSGINFNMDGLVLDNTTWYNAKTGDSFKVRSNYFEDNHMMLQTYDGRIIDMEQMTDYVQWTGSGEPPKPEPTQAPGNQNNDISDLPPEVLSILENGDGDDPYGGMDPEDYAMIHGAAASGATPNLNVGRSKQDGFHPIQPKSSNYSIIERALTKVQEPEFNIVMKWPKFPQREIEMLVDVMDIPTEEISDYYLNKVTDEMDKFMNSMKSQLSDYLKDKLKKQEEPNESKITSKGKETVTSGRKRK